jgi:hypothetical protein
MLRRLVTSKYLPSFHPTERYARLRLPFSGSLGLHFPTFPVAARSVLRPSVLCSATTADGSSRITSLVAGDTIPTLLSWFVLRVCGSLSGRSFRVVPNASAPGRLSQPVPLTWRIRWETVGSLKFPSCPLEHMPCSQTPVVSYSLAIARIGRLPSAGCTASAFPLASSEVILGVRP